MNNTSLNKCPLTPFSAFTNRNVLNNITVL